MLAEVMINTKLQNKLRPSSQALGLLVNNTKNHRNMKKILNLLKAVAWSLAAINWPVPILVSSITSPSTS